MGQMADDTPRPGQTLHPVSWPGAMRVRPVLSSSRAAARVSARPSAGAQFSAAAEQQQGYRLVHLPVPSSQQQQSSSSKGIGSSICRCPVLSSSRAAAARVSARPSAGAQFSAAEQQQGYRLVHLPVPSSQQQSSSSKGIGSSICRCPVLSSSRAAAARVSARPSAGAQFSAAAEQQQNNNNKEYCLRHLRETSFQQQHGYRLVHL